VLSKWTLFKGDIAAKLMGQIGNDIDMAFNITNILTLRTYIFSN
jgi:hypothetical protein